jgi:hypothetical protein
LCQPVVRGQNGSWRVMSDRPGLHRVDGCPTCRGHTRGGVRGVNQFRVSSESAPSQLRFSSAWRIRVTRLADTSSAGGVSWPESPAEFPGPNLRRRFPARISADSPADFPGPNLRRSFLARISGGDSRLDSESPPILRRNFPARMSGGVSWPESPAEFLSPNLRRRHPARISGGDSRPESPAKIPCPNVRRRLPARMSGGDSRPE